MAIILLLTFLLSFFVLIFHKYIPKTIGYLSALVTFGIFLYFTSFIKVITAGQTVVHDLHWVPLFDVSLRFYLDGLSLFFALLVSFFGSLILMYASKYMEGKRQVNRFLFYLILFMSSMLGLVLSDHILLFYIFWELTSVSSYFLISYNNGQEESRRAALQALLVTNLGGLALFGGLLLLGNSAGSYHISEIIQSKIVSFDYYMPIAILILIGCFTKSAQFPFHFWLPNAMAAPTPVSAFLHSATMVKAGIFLIMRLNPALSGTDLWMYMLVFFGGMTALLGALKSLLQNDLKKILAYVTISTLGLLVATIGVGNTLALQAALIYLLVHACYKGALFLLVGNIDKQTKTRDVNQLSGLFETMPYSGVATALACLAMAGLPPTLGFIAKEKLYESLLVNNLLFAIIFVVSAIYVTLAIRIAYGVFFGRRKLPEVDDDSFTYTESSWMMWLPPMVFGCVGILFGLLGNSIASFLGQSSSSLMLEEKALDLGMWHGINWVLFLSIFTWVIGWIIYKYYLFVNKLVRYIIKSIPVSIERIYFWVLDVLTPMATKLILNLQNGQLTRYLKIIFATLILLLAAVYFKLDLLPTDWNFQQEIKLDRIYEFLPVMLILFGTIITLKNPSRLVMLVALSLLGFGVALFFAMFSAPDVSMTQFLVETITLVIFTIILRRLPKNASFPRVRRQLLMVLVSLSFGIMMTLILSTLQGFDPDPALKSFFLENSAPRGKGENVVNVILVDFRAFDTFGEMIVLSMTALGVMALIQLKPKEEKS
ncbi:DUF4040 domain-containing protein [Olivibacter sp. SDN3]|uniref:hydrogen gas-evolving membrane-bound hydrogenase subunit E n=1 Tax=Olivibacter sp. SDN3 TaxID=2764720 RepID=UPI0016510C07|nr:hydrogen gas-evolving membrane-bound hydrogenase subunit E [Olivibacter sp. SDN3]QNL49091.1 DUF4040 domain-containing protein [Olivibacter sp. SDN3]